MISFEDEFESKVSLEEKSAAVIEEQPFHILLLGDWCGDGGESVLSRRRSVVIDRDDFDDVMRKLNVRLDLDLQNDGNLLSLNFSGLEDFHPDGIFRQVSLFSELREIRQRLLNPDSFNQAARKVSSWFNLSEPERSEKTEEKKDNTQETSSADSGNLLDQILSKPEEDLSVSAQTTESKELNELLRKLVKPHLVRIDESEQTRLLAAVDDATSNLMRLILHNKRFQSLEAAWRSLYFLLGKVETGVNLKIFLLNASKSELLSNLKSVSDLTDSFLYQCLIRETSAETLGGESWAVIGGNYTFSLNVDDIAALIRVAKLANTAKAPFISHIKSEMSQVSSLATNPIIEEWNISVESNENKLWTTLRSVPESSYLGLALPRFLIRLPYGEDTEPLESFAFEEFTDSPNHEDYLWANPCFACILLLGQSFHRYGWQIERFYQDIDGLPAYFYREDNETFTKPCAEVLMTLDACSDILNQGLMPLLSFKDSDKIRLPRFQSVALPITSLQGKWNS